MARNIENTDLSGSHPARIPTRLVTSKKAESLQHHDVTDLRALRAIGGRADEKDDLWWHGSGSGDLRGGTSGLHLGTRAAAEDALNARIGFPAEGSWDGTRSYGDTLLAGQRTLRARDPRGYNLTGYNSRAPEEDYYAHQHPEGLAAVSGGVRMQPGMKPSIRPFRLVGRMTNSPSTPHDDFKANGYMKAALKRGNAKHGYFYKNQGEDSGSLSIVVPGPKHIEPADAKLQKARGGSVNHSPTEAQKAAGNYAKKHISFQGIPVTIENEMGSVRSGRDRNGKAWSCKLPADYGYVKRTEGADGDHVDVYVGPDKHSNLVVIVDQQHLDSRQFDEHKCLLGFVSEQQALRCYRDGFSDGKGNDRIGHVKSMSVDAFKRWLKSDKTTKPAARQDIVAQALNLVGRQAHVRT